MKPVKVGLHIWIAITSILSFLGGWALFSHAGKPVPLFPSASTSTQQLPVDQAALPPVPSIDQLTSGSNPSGLQPLPPFQNSAPSFMPRFRTMGS